MTTHQLAKLLLERPDVDVWGCNVGQGAGEGDDEPLFGVVYESGVENYAKFCFFDPDLGRNRESVTQTASDQFWIPRR